MSKLLAFGDSFTYGTELEDTSCSWPNLVATHFDLELDNQAIPGCSNARTTRILVAQDLSNVKLVCIGWSHFDRTEVSDEVGSWDIWPGGERKPCVKEAAFRKQLVEYTTRHHNDDVLYSYYLCHIILVQDYLKHNNIPYVMMDAFGNHLDPRRSSTQFSSLTNKVDSTHFLGWPDQSMQEWTQGLPIGPGLHFLEQGHRAVADHVIKQVEKFYEL